MKESARTIALCLIILFLVGESALIASKNDKDLASVGENVIVSPNAISMPLGRILLIRKEAAYGAIKFLKSWTGKSEHDLYATYESHYQGDGTEDFTNKNAKSSEQELHSPKPSFSLFGHPFAFGIREEVKCGPIKLWWVGAGTVCFFGRSQRQGDYGIEFAPTKWTDLSQVNVSDPRLKWYRYDASRKDIEIPVNQLWEGNDQGRR